VKRLLLVVALLGLCVPATAENISLETVYQDCVSQEAVDQLSCLSFLFGHFVAVTTSPTPIYCNNQTTNGQLQAAFVGWYVMNASKKPKLGHLWYAWTDVGICVVKEQQPTEKELMEQGDGDTDG